MNHRNGFLKRAVLFTAFFILINISHSTRAANHKGLWVVRNSITNKKDINDFIKFAKDNNISDLFVQVRGRGDAYYKSQIVPFSFKITEDFDPLAYILTMAHAYNIKVHAWVNVFLLWTAKAKPKDSQNLLFLHPEWTAVDENGLRDSDKHYYQFAQQNTEGIYLSPMEPKVQQYLLSVFNELIENYNIDGLHLDYVRFAKNNYGYHQSGRRKFEELYGFNPIYLTFSDKSLLDGIENFDEHKYQKIFTDFRCAEITEFVKNVSLNINKSGKEILLSAAVKPDPFGCKHYFLQDWIKWINEDYIDFAVPMNYTEDGKIFEQIAKEISTLVPTEKVWMGIGAYKQNKYDASEKTMLTISYGYRGVVYFSYNTFTDHKNYFNTLNKVLDTWY